MSPAQHSATIANAQHSTGPRTPEGKAASSQNATKSGLFSTRDFIRPGEESIYAELCESVRRTLAPEGDLECTLADEIRRAMWRLRRCGETEASMVETCALAVGNTEQAEAHVPIPDAMQIEATAKLQATVDRARSLCHRLIHKATRELRKLQTERMFRHETLGGKNDLSFMGLCDLRIVRRSLDESVAGQLRKHTADEIERNATYERQCREDDAVTEAVIEKYGHTFPETKQTREPAGMSRNSRCACGSGLKYKRCCALKTAA